MYKIIKSYQKDIRNCTKEINSVKQYISEQHFVQKWKMKDFVFYAGLIESLHKSIFEYEKEIEKYKMKLLS